MKAVFILMIIFGLLGIISYFKVWYDAGKKDMLDKMYESGDINSKIYSKYRKEL